MPQVSQCIIDREKVIRAFVRITQKDSFQGFREYIGIAPRTFSKIWNYKPVNISTATRIANKLGVALDSILVDVKVDDTSIPINRADEISWEVHNVVY